MKKILIAADYDPSVEKVSDAGYRLGKAMEAEIVLLHVISDPVYYSSLQYSPVLGFDGFNTPDLTSVADTGELHKAANLFLKKIAASLGDDRLEIVTAEGDIAEAILKVAKEKAADIIVIGSHGRSGLNKLLMGSVAEKVLHHSAVPLLIVPVKA